jgi:hypothetical protein
VEGHFHEDGREIAESEAIWVLFEERRRRGQLEAEPKIEPEAGCNGRQLGVVRADGLLPLRRQGKHRPDVRGGVENPRPAPRRASAELEPFLDALGPVVTRGNDVRVDVDEHWVHPTHAAAASGTSGFVFHTHKVPPPRR